MSIFNDMDQQKKLIELVRGRVNSNVYQINEDGTISLIGNENYFLNKEWQQYNGDILNVKGIFMNASQIEIFDSLCDDGDHREQYNIFNVFNREEVVWAETNKYKCHDDFVSSVVDEVVDFLENIADETITTDKDIVDRYAVSYDDHYDEDTDIDDIDTRNLYRDNQGVFSINEDGERFYYEFNIHGVILDDDEEENFYKFLRGEQ